MLHLLTYVLALRRFVDCSISNGDCDAKETCTTVDLLYANANICRCSKGFTRSKLWEICTGMRFLTVDSL